MEGIFIPMEFQELDCLTNTESMVLAIYKYYTEKGNLHCCSLRNEDICKMVRLKDESGLRKVKKHLKELGYIRTDGGIRVYYLGLGGEYIPKKEGINSPQGGNIIPQGGEYIPKKEGINSPQGGNIIPQGGEYIPKKEGINSPHNKKEKKEKRKKEIKKEMSEKKTNLDLLLDRLPDDYKTPETMKFIKKNLMEKINQADLSDDGKIDSCVVSLKSLLLKEFTIYPVINKPVPVKKTNDDDFMW